MAKLSHRKGTVCFVKLLCLVFEYSLSIEDLLTLLLFSIYCSLSTLIVRMGDLLLVFWVAMAECFALAGGSFSI